MFITKKKNTLNIYSSMFILKNLDYCKKSQKWRKKANTNKRKSIWKKIQETIWLSRCGKNEPAIDQYRKNRRKNFNINKIWNWESREGQYWRKRNLGGNNLWKQRSFNYAFQVKSNRQWFCWNVDYNFKLKFIDQHILEHDTKIDINKSA